MDTCKVKLTISRAGPDVDQKRGDEVEVSLLEAGRLLRQGACEKPDAKTLKAIAAAEAEAAKETATAAPAEDEAAQGDAPAGDTETAAAGEGAGDTETAGE